MGGKSRRRLLLALFGVPCLLLWVSLKIAQGRPHLFITRKSQVSDFYFPEDGKSVCPSDEDSVKCYDRSTREDVSSRYANVLQHGDAIAFQGRNSKTKSAPPPLDGDVMAVFSSDDRFATLANRNEVKRWDFQRGRFLWQTHFEPPTPDPYGDVVVKALSPDGALCVVVRNDDSARINWIIGDCRTGKVVAPLNYPKGEGYPHDFSFSPDGRTLCMVTDYAAYFLDSRTARLLWEEEFIEPNYTPSGLVGIPRAHGFDFLDARSGKLKRHLAFPSDSQVEAWSFSHDGKQLWWSTPRHQIFWYDLN